jgi:hypothetical protein
MTTSIEIEVESEESCDCCADCKMGSGKATKPAESKDALLKQLKDLLGNSNSTGMADRQLAIDALIEKIGELED